MLRFLLDVHLPLAVSTQIPRKRPDISIHHLSRWKRGIHREDIDEIILEQAAAENLTCVTYDLKTIPRLLAQWSESGVDHGGVIFVDERTAPSRDIGSLVRQLIRLWDNDGRLNWTNRVYFLRGES